MNYLKLWPKQNQLNIVIKKSNLCKAKESRLTSILDQLNIQIEKGDRSTETLKLFENTKKELEIIKLNRTKGAIVRSRAKHIEEGEKNSKYFMNLEKDRSKNNTINMLKKDSGPFSIKDEIEFFLK